MNFRKDKGIIISCIILIVIILVTGILSFCIDWGQDSNIASQIISFSGIIIAGLGFFATIYTLSTNMNRFFNESERKRKDFLDMFLSINNQEDFYSIKTQVINKSGLDKEINFAFLLISPQDNWAKIIGFINNEYKLDIRATNGFLKLKNIINKPFFRENAAIIPLDFYYKENIGIGNENPSYTYTFNCNASNTKLNSGIYSVRFFIFPEYNGDAIYHRSTVDSLIIS